MKGNIEREDARRATKEERRSKGTNSGRQIAIRLRFGIRGKESEETK